jgi:hypothetical protein
MTCWFTTICVPQPLNETESSVHKLNEYGLIGCFKANHFHLLFQFFTLFRIMQHFVKSRNIMSFLVIKSFYRLVLTRILLNVDS